MSARSTLVPAPATAPAGGRADAGRSRRLHVLIVDDYELVRAGLHAMLLRCSWVADCAVAGSAREALAVAGRLRPQVAVIDVFVGGEDGVEISRSLVEAHPGLRVLLLLSGVTRPSTTTARAAGAVGLVSKNRGADELIRAIQLVALGRTTFDADAQAEVPISARELDVLKLIASGWTNCEIADTLGLSPNTVKQHARTLYRKLNARNRAQAVRRAQAAGLLG
jgi:DNA-binding NarL/FixJ family response regulator